MNPADNSIDIETVAIQNVIRKLFDLERESQLPIAAAIICGSQIYIEDECDARKSAVDHAEMRALRLMTYATEAERTRAILISTVAPCAMCVWASFNSGISHIKYVLDAAGDGYTDTCEAPSPIPLTKLQVPDIGQFLQPLDLYLERSEPSRHYTYAKALAERNEHLWT